MTPSSYPSRLLESAVNEFAKLPGIGKKTALRLVLHLLKQEKEVVFKFSDTLHHMRAEIVYCSSCHNISDSEVCNICADPNRDHSLICVVESIRDVMAIESTQQFAGIYHVLGGVISPMDGIGPDDLTIGPLEDKIKAGAVKEVIFALSTTMEGDTTNYYLFKRLKEFEVEVSTIARGVAIGDDLEYTDELTLGRSILNRLPFNSTLTH